MIMMIKMKNTDNVFGLVYPLSSVMEAAEI